MSDSRGHAIESEQDGIKLRDCGMIEPQFLNGTTKIRVFVHLARDKDVDQWRAARAAGTLVGINDPTPYGYGRAEALGCSVTFSRSHRESLLSQFIRLGLRVVTGFDLVHAWRQRHAMRQADIIWTHTESQFLGVAAIVGKGPLILGQVVWLFDRWADLGSIRRALFRRLIERVDVLTVHSEDNLAIARAAFPAKRVERIPFGISSEIPLETKLRSNTPIRVLAIGNDRHRDWATLIAAAKDCDDIEVAIFSGSINRRLANAVPNVNIAVLRTNVGLQQEMARATVVCVPLKTNHHASGITVIQEAVIMGVPVVATDTGGLRGYFGDAEIRYVPVGDAAALRSAVRAVASDPAAATAMADRAQAHLFASELNADSYIRRHVVLSRELLDAARQEARVEPYASQPIGS